MNTVEDDITMLQKMNVIEDKLDQILEVIGTVKKAGIELSQSPVIRTMTRQFGIDLDEIGA